MAKKRHKEGVLDLTRPVDLVSEGTIAVALGVGTKAVQHIARTDPSFPKPFTVLPGGVPRYDADAVRAWMRVAGTVHRTATAGVRRQRSAVVYFIRCGEFVKIGFTSDVAARLAMLQTGTPHELDVLATAPGGVEEEGRLHALFAEERVRPDGEWFRLSPRLLDHIAAIRPRDGA